MKRYRCLVAWLCYYRLGKIYDEKCTKNDYSVGELVQMYPCAWELVENDDIDKPSFHVEVIADWVKCSDGCCDIDIYRIIENGEEVDVCDANPNSLIERLNSRYNLGFKFDNNG